MLRLARVSESAHIEHLTNSKRLSVRGLTGKRLYMTSIDKQLSELKARLEELTSDEMRLIKELEDALIKADNQLQNEIDNVFTSHLRRRECLASSLVDLARNLGRLPLPSQQAAEIDYAPHNDVRLEQQGQAAAPSEGWDFPAYQGQLSGQDVKPN